MDFFEAEIRDIEDWIVLEIRGFCTEIQGENVDQTYLRLRK